MWRRKKAIHHPPFDEMRPRAGRPRLVGNKGNGNHVSIFYLELQGEGQGKASDGIHDPTMAIT